MTLIQLRVLSAVAGQGSVRGAARALDMAQSGITQQLHKLEQFAGGPLFNRTNRGVTLTLLGERLLARADAILGECTRAEHEMRQLQGDISGVVSFGIALEPLIRSLPSVLNDFNCRHPRVELHLMGGTSRKMISWVRKGSLDFALALISDTTDTADLLVSPLYPSQPAIVCRKDHPLRNKTSIADLVDCRWISTRQPDLTESPASRLIDLFAKNGLPKPRVVATTEALFDTLHLVSQTDYLSLEPEIVSRHPFFVSTLTCIPIAEAIKTSEVCLVHRSAVPLTPAAQQLLAMLASHSRTVFRKHQS
ncbi:MAG: LysR substrate-binding domain-containing protein [Pseudomonadota bacterium]